MTMDDSKRGVRMSDLDDSDKPREKALKNGIGSLSNTELLAIVIGSGLPGMPVTELSRSILASVSNRLSALASQTIHEIARGNKGIGPAKAVAIAAAFELGRRCAAEMPREDLQVRTSSELDSYIRHNTNLETIRHEEFWVLLMSRSNRIKSAHCISKGGTMATVVDVKLIMKLAVDLLADGIVVVHNHPSGNAKPSLEDKILTDKIKKACDIFSIRLIDHIIIAGKRYYSFNDEGK